MQEQAFNKIKEEIEAHIKKEFAMKLAEIFKLKRDSNGKLNLNWGKKKTTTEATTEIVEEQQESKPKSDETKKEEEDDKTD